MKDSYKFLGRRKDLVDEIKSKGISDKDILESFLLTPRHYFVDSGLEEHAYIDKALPIFEIKLYLSLLVLHSKHNYYLLKKSKRF